MNDIALQAMKEAHQALILALDGNDIAGIEAAMAAVGACAGDLQATARGPIDADTRALAIELRALSDQARMRVNFLTDLVGRRLERLAALRGKGRVSLYAREGR